MDLGATDRMGQAAFCLKKTCVAGEARSQVFSGWPYKTMFLTLTNMPCGFELDRGKNEEMA